MTDKIGNGSMPLRIGNLIDTEVYGGRYRERRQGFFCVKMAEEIIDYADVDVPTEDFQVPEMSDLHAGVMKALGHMAFRDEPVYVGCMGGIGRTGLFLAALAKVQIEVRRMKHRKGRGDDPVKYVRQHYIPHALETQEQQDFISRFDALSIAEWLDHTQEVMGMKTGFKRTQRYTVHETKPEDRVLAVREVTEEVPLNYTIVEDTIAEPEPDDINPEMVSEIAQLIERDLDWMDAIDADSLSEAEEGTIEDEQMADLYETIDELEARVGAAERLATEAGEHSVLVRKLLYIWVQDLTKQTVFERIRSWFR